MRNSGRPRFEIVRPTQANPQLEAEHFAMGEWQTTMFASKNPSLLIFVDPDNINQDEFVTIVSKASPRYIVDLRLYPLVQFGSLNRKSVFELFEKNKVKYLDLAGRLALRLRDPSRLDPKIYMNAFLQLAGDKDGRLEGPITFLLDPDQIASNFIEGCASLLASASEFGWETMQVPIPVPATEETDPFKRRDLIFISHANPEDNAFALWLGTRLAAAGYHIWSDVTRLLGGDVFWDDIEEAIRLHSAKVLVVLSKNSVHKNGVLDEINCAVTVERTQGRMNFVIPIRLDDLPFSQVRANLARKNVIDFSSNWATGFDAILRTLERDNVAKSNPKGASFASKWSRKATSESSNVVRIPESVVSNWIPVLGLPPDVVLHDVNADSNSIAKIQSALTVPSFRYLRLIGTFASSDELSVPGYAGPLFSEKYRIPLDTFLSGHSHDLPGLEWNVAQNFVSSLSRQAWNSFAASRGLLSFVPASGATAWYIPKDLLPDNRAYFTDEAGKQRRKDLVGHSEKRGVYWHYAVELRPSLSRSHHFVVRPHIVFSEDGKTLLSSKERMHSLRRSFCRNWWNDRWRDLLLAFVTWMANGGDVIDLKVADGQSIQIGGRPLSFFSEVSVTETEEDPHAIEVDGPEFENEDPDLEFEEYEFEEHDAELLP